MAINYAVGNRSFCTDGEHNATRWSLKDWDKLYATGKNEQGEMVILPPDDFADYALGEKIME